MQPLLWDKSESVVSHVANKQFLLLFLLSLWIKIH